MSVSYEEIGHLSVTFPASGCTGGHVCKMGTDGKVTACSDGDAFCGVVESLFRASAKTNAGVQLHGFVEVPYTGTAPVCGYVGLSADGTGGVKADSAGKSYLVAAVSAAKQTVTFEL